MSGTRFGSGGEPARLRVGIHFLLAGLEPNRWGAIGARAVPQECEAFSHPPEFEREHALAPMAPQAPNRLSSAQSFSKHAGRFRCRIRLIR